MSAARKRKTFFLHYDVFHHAWFEGFAQSQKRVQKGIDRSGLNDNTVKSGCAMDGKELEYKGEAALQELEMLTMNAKDVQERILTEILERNKTTEYLSKYMKGSTDISLFKRNVPVVTYDMIQPYILRIANGEDSSIISGHPITELIRSSGTSSGEPRLMPSIEEDLDRRTYLYNLIMPIMNNICRGWTRARRCTSLVKAESPTPRPPRALGPHQLLQEPHFATAPILQRLHDPDAAILCADSRQSMYCQLLAGVLHRRRVLRSARLRLRPPPSLASSTATGPTSPATSGPLLTLASPTRRAARHGASSELRTLASRGDRGDLQRGVVRGIWADWPTRMGEDPARVHDVCVLGMLFWGEFGAPVRSHGRAYTLLPTWLLRVHTFGGGIKAGDEEERVESEKVVGLVDVKNLPGLYRYRVGDVLQVTGSTTTPSIQVHMSANLLESQNYLLLEYTSYADTSTVPGHYVLFWEIKNIFEEAETPRPPAIDAKLLESCCVAVEESLDYVYRRCRSHDKSVGPLEIRIVEAGTFENLMDLLISQGSSINQYKAPRCVEPGPALKLLNSKVVGCFFSPKNPTWKI
ncbi:putative indole-3-acetic acid-amido synthetase GH3.11 [Ananas comosus]|uniref:Putative indole-3-acetic acid-amido synthetase GH3.11 n=1 Tax=Ananas comosus TaxID=4615 RepID=A0A199VBS7_ANACO|nr:putative indole-3-acetic acid-amido synthetase GH3.11 [Ananas comosus]